ncbi:hypothetical protein Phi4:1_gp119 [Cellulophaga phage phi4:1]|uniref:Uncharacterized protein n=3 Tax=Lightbulbvirus Cba41 TaxID=1918524 RepID=A0A0S2MWM6_9CAUD|nr:hypothetical protein Phi4:1_gp119 [Cellulophaga phage phi4:1]AGO49532.1 hypothetical protein Phi4:1_gp119 [Cellulophaga phage phi4:1]ALO80128.1 hypothetical protein Phi4113_119 [Cellulophaga phage phi4:1_13]ALO80325.1 hypothetical protein Phi4118_119 [Cellulophaga phage phi4:1_18]
MQVLTLTHLIIKIEALPIKERLIELNTLEEIKTKEIERCECSPLPFMRGNVNNLKAERMEIRRAINTAKNLTIY